MLQQPIPAGRPGFIPRTAAASLVFLTAGLIAAAADTPARKTVVAGNYNAGGFHRFFLGDEYRKAWGTPVSVEVLDLGKGSGRPRLPRAPGRRAADEGPRPHRRGRAELHLPRPGEGRLASARRHRRHAEGLRSSRSS